MITSLFNKILNAWKCNERLLTLLKPRSRHFLVIICWLGGVYIGHPPNVYGLEFQADGWLMLQNDREEDFVKDKPPECSLLGRMQS